MVDKELIEMVKYATGCNSKQAKIIADETKRQNDIKDSEIEEKDKEIQRLKKENEKLTYEFKQVVKQLNDYKLISAGLNRSFNKTFNELNDLRKNHGLKKKTIKEKEAEEE